MKRLKRTILFLFVMTTICVGFGNVLSFVVTDDSIRSGVSAGVIIPLFMFTVFALGYTWGDPFFNAINRVLNWLSMKEEDKSNE